MPRLAASAAPCSPPAPPKATRGTRAGSSPRCHGHDAHRAAHGGARHREHGLGRRLRPDAEAPREDQEGAPHGVFVEREPPAEEGARRHVAEGHVGVGDRQPVAPAVAHGPGVRPGARRADVQHAARVDLHQRPAAAADGVDVERGHEDRVARDLERLGRARVHRRGARVVEGDVGARAAHVEAHQALEAGLARGARRGHDAAGGAGQEDAHGLERRALRGQRPAVGLQDGEPRRGEGLGQGP
jgi:hypothetical protein